MPQQTHVVRVLIASPGDLHSVRALVPPLFTEWNSAGHRQVVLSPMMWEHSSTPEMGSHPQDILDRQLVEKSDLLVAVFWTRIGTETAKHISGTIQEIEKFIEIKGPKRAMIYFFDKPIDINPMDLDLAQLQQLRDYRTKIQKQALVCSVSDESEFKLKLYQHLDSKVIELMAGHLPEPSAAVGASLLPDQDDDAKWPCEITVEGIASAFERYWSQMCARGDKFRDEGGRLAARFARALDKLLVANQFTMSEAKRSVFREQSHALKKLQLNARSEFYRSAVPTKFWRDGAEIAERLAVHASFVRKSS